MTKEVDRELQDVIDELLDSVAVNLGRLIENERRLPEKNRKNKLAAAAGVGKGTVQRILEGSHPPDDRPPTAAQIDTLMKLAYYFDVPLWTFFAPTSKKAKLLETPPRDFGALPGRELKSRRNRSLAER